MSDAMRITLSPAVVARLLRREHCGENSDPAVWAVRGKEIKLKESRKHAGLTSRSQVSPQARRGFQIARKPSILHPGYPETWLLNLHAQPWVPA
jgi:hypothetical protein